MDTEEVHHTPKPRKIRQRKSIYDTLVKYDLPDNICVKADQIFQQMTACVHRGNVRKQLFYYCSYHAYRELEQPVDIIDLANMFSLTASQAQHSHSLFSPIQTGYQPKNITLMCPTEMIPGLCKRLLIPDEYISDIIEFTKNIMNKAPSLKQESPQSIAAGILKYYIISNGFELEKMNEFQKIVGRSNVTIDQRVKEISMIDGVEAS